MTKAERDFLEAARKWCWYEHAYTGAPGHGGGGFGLKECREADQAKRDLLASYCALLAEEEERKGGDPPAHANHTDQSGNEHGGAVARAATTAPAAPVAEPKRGVQEGPE